MPINRKSFTGSVRKDAFRFLVRIFSDDWNISFSVWFLHSHLFNKNFEDKVLIFTAFVCIWLKFLLKELHVRRFVKPKAATRSFTDGYTVEMGIQIELLSFV